MGGKPQKISMSRSERFVTSLAAAVLVAGFATEAFVKSANISMHKPALSAHVEASQTIAFSWPLATKGETAPSYPPGTVGFAPVPLRPLGHQVRN